MAGLHFYIELLPENFGLASYQILHVVDKLADQEGNASGRIGHMLSALENSDTQIRVPPPRLSSRAHACAIASDHNQPLMRHSNLPPSSPESGAV
jgi:hypothetical protein